jgi:N-glycosylase/DNA lyase
MKALGECGALKGGSEEEVRACLVHKHRFPNARAKYIAEAQRLRGTLKHTIVSMPNSREARDWLVANVKGLGMKEASHFLRNVGYLDLAIVDKHIMSHMEETGLIIERPSALSRKKYMEYEGMLARVAEDLGMPLGVMDLYLWSKKSGEVLK